MKNSNRAKHFQFLDSDLIRSKAIRSSGTICVLPAAWFNKKVLVTFEYENHYDFFHMIVKLTKLRAFISVAHMYLGQTATIKLLEPLEYQQVKPKELISCSCGCGEQVEKKKTGKGYIYKHHLRLLNVVKHG